jgi:hypothetical protein
MSNFLFDLVTNLAILALLLGACHLCNLAKPEFAFNGGYAFVVLAVTTMAFDAALTFLVFADAPSRYGKFSSPGGFVQRATACALGCAVALYLGRRVRLRRRRASHAHDIIVIRTSAYTESHLPM